MTISEQDIARIAKLANIALTDEDARNARQDLDGMLSLIARLQEVQAAEMAAKIAEHLRDYADDLRDANKRYAEAVDDSAALVEIALEENALELQDLAKEYNWSVGSAEEALFQALQRAQCEQNATIVFVVCDRGDRYLSTGVFPV